MSSNARLLIAFFIAVLLTVLLGGVLSVPWLLSAPLGLTSMFFSYNMIRSNPKRLASREQAKRLVGFPQYREMIEDAKEDMDYLEEARRREREPEVRQAIANLQETGQRIMDYLAKHPQRISSARRFFTYYLDTAVSVLKQLSDLRETGLSHAEVQEGKQKAIETLPRLNQAFEAQYSKLIDGDLISLQAEAKLLETAMRMDGFKVDSMEAKELPADIEQLSADAVKVSEEAMVPPDESDGVDTSTIHPDADSQQETSEDQAEPDRPAE